MTVFDLAKNYSPRLWDKDRIEALVAAGRLSEEEAAEIMGEEAVKDADSGISSE